MSELIDNSQQRIGQLKKIITDLHAGEDPATVKQKLRELVHETTSEEIVIMEQQLIQEGMSVEEIKQMCDLHSEITSEILTQKIETTQSGHPHHTFRLENEAINAAAGRMRAVLTDLSTLADEDSGELTALLERWRSCMDDLLEVEKHYARKENLLFSYLEKHGISGPSQVMWGKDDDIRIMLKALREALQEKGAQLAEWKLVAEHVAAPLLNQVEEMIRKEENILLPMSLSKLEPSEWGAIWRQSPRFGYCLVEPGIGYEPPREEAAMTEDEAAGLAVLFSTGSLDHTQLRGLFRTLPFDLTYVDSDDRVAFFSEGAERIFARTVAVIGRKVQNCHPPASVDIVDRILADFRSGKQDKAEFWIQMQGRFIHIRYFAMRDAENQYLGTLEVTQDLTPLRALDGERRLLQYDDPPAGNG